MSKTTRTLSVDIEIESQKSLANIIKKTGETKVDLFKRLIDSEYKRIVNGVSINESLYLQFEKLQQTLNDIEPMIKTSSDDTAAVREGISRIYCAVLFSIKELIRTMHFISGCFLNSALLPKEQLSIISNNADQQSINSFNASYKILSESSPKEIVDILKKK